MRNSAVNTKEIRSTKNLDETVRLHSEKRDEWMREIGGERLSGTVDWWDSAPLRANALTVLPVK